MTSQQVSRSTSTRQVGDVVCRRSWVGPTWLQPAMPASFASRQHWRCFTPILSRPSLSIRLSCVLSSRQISRIFGLISTVRRDNDSSGWSVSSPIPKLRILLGGRGSCVHLAEMAHISLESTLTLGSDGLFLRDRSLVLKNGSLWKV
jgi:hypothetical protein